MIARTLNKLRRLFVELEDVQVKGDSSGCLRFLGLVLRTNVDGIEEQLLEELDSVSGVLIAPSASTNSLSGDEVALEDDGGVVRESTEAAGVDPVLFGVFDGTFSPSALNS